MRRDFAGIRDFDTRLCRGVLQGPLRLNVSDAALPVAAGVSGAVMLACERHGRRRSPSR